MKVIKRILSIIFNPINSISFGKSNDKLAELFTTKPILIFIVSLLVSAIIFVLGYYIV
jgi:hypothetical protein